MNFVGQRGWFYLVSLLVIVPGVVFLAIAPGLRPGIDFTGGSTLTLDFENSVDQTDLRERLAALGHPEATVQKLGDDTYFIRTKELNDAEKSALTDGLQARLSPDGLTELSFDLVSPVVASETVVNAIYAVAAAAVGIFIYVWWAFRNVPSPFRYGTAAIIALIHDTIIVIGVFAILGVLLEIEVGTMFLIALLTVIGYSVNDTIVVFDRIRENVTVHPNRELSRGGQPEHLGDDRAVAEHQLDAAGYAARAVPVRRIDDQGVPDGAADRGGRGYVQLYRGGEPGTDLVGVRRHTVAVRTWAQGENGQRVSQPPVTGSAITLTPKGG